MRAFIIMGRVLKAAYEELFLCVYLSIAWWLSFLPLGITVAPATMGMHKVANRMANYKRVDNGFFWEGFRAYFGQGQLMLAIDLLVPGAILFNIWFYANSGSWLPALGLLWFWVLLFSLLAGMYLIPLFWQQDEPHIRLALRNAALLTLKYPLYSLLMLIFLLLMLALSFVTVLPMVLLAPALIAITGNFALAGMLQEMGLSPEPPEGPARD